MPIYMRQGSNNIKIGTVAQKQGGNAIIQDSLYMRQGSGNVLVHQVAKGGYLHNCTASYDSPSDSLILTPIDNTKYYYAFLKGEAQSEYNFFNLSDGSGGSEWSQVSVMWGNITPTTEVLTERPDPTTTTFSLYSDHLENGYGENTGWMYVNGNKLSACYWYYPGFSFPWSFNDPEYDDIFETELYLSGSYETVYINGKPFDGAILVWVNPSGLGSAPTCGAVSVMYNNTAYDLKVWS